MNRNSDGPLIWVVKWARVLHNPDNNLGDFLEFPANNPGYFSY